MLTIERTAFKNAFLYQTAYLCNQSFCYGLINDLCHCMMCYFLFKNTTHMQHNEIIVRFHDLQSINKQ